MEDRALEGRVALVTGAGRGIGASTAAHLARRGARVVIAARSEGELTQVAQAADELGSVALPVVCDVSDPGQVALLFEEAQARLGPVDILVNNAGTLVASPFYGTSLADWEKTLAVNLTGTFLCTQAALKHMLPRRRGVIVNVASVAGMAGVPKLPGLAAYAASKGGVLALSEALAAELRPQGIRVVAVSPGSTRTKMLGGVAPQMMDKAMTPGTVGRVIAWLASDEAAGITEANVPVWGPVGKPAGEGEQQA